MVPNIIKQNLGNLRSLPIIWSVYYKHIRQKRFFHILFIWSLWYLVHIFYCSNETNTNRGGNNDSVPSGMDSLGEQSNEDIDTKL